MVKERSKSWSYDHEHDRVPVGYDLMKSINMDSDWWCSRFRSSRCDSTYNYELLMELINTQTDVKGKFHKRSSVMMKNDVMFASESENMVMASAKESGIKTAETVAVDTLYKGGGCNNDSCVKKDGVGTEKEGYTLSQGNNKRKDAGDEKETIENKKKKPSKRAASRHEDKNKPRKQPRDENIETKSRNEKAKLIDDTVIDESYWKRQTKNKARKSWIAKSLRTISCFGGRVVK